MTTAEQSKCRCGMPMLMTERGAAYCENCDVVQPQEPFGISRRKTPQDIRFDMSWLQTINKEYKDNTPQEPKVGTANPEESEDDAPDEGEEHE